MPVLLALALSGLAAGTAGCGEGDGVEAGATVHVYVAAPLCAEAQHVVMRAGGKAGDVRVRAICLADPSEGRRLDLAMVGANARRATEDSTSVAYLESGARGAPFAQTIIEEAGIAFVIASSGANAGQRVLQAIAGADSGSSSLRDEVRHTLEAE